MSYHQFMAHKLHDKIREVLENSPHLTQRGLSQRMGLNPAAVNRMLYGDRRILAEEIPIIEAYIGVKLDLQYPQDSKPQRIRRSAVDNAPAPFESLAPVPVYGYAAGSENADKSSGELNLANGEVVDWVQRHPSQIGVRDAFAIYVFSDSMEPRYFRGELIFVHPGRPPEPNKDVIIEMKSGDAFIKRLLKMGDAKIRVRQFNPPADADISMKEVKAVYTVIGRG